MIEGMKLTISSGELKKLLQERVVFHNEKAAMLRAEAESLAPKLRGMEVAARHQGKYGVSNSAQGDPAEQMAASADHHADRAVYFKFLAEHVIENETYLFTEMNLREIEVLRRF
jgi:hypothetical protein